MPLFLWDFLLKKKGSCSIRRRLSMTAECCALSPKVLSLLMVNFMRHGILCQEIKRLRWCLLTGRKFPLEPTFCWKRRGWKVLWWGVRSARISGCPRSLPFPMLWQGPLCWSIFPHRTRRSARMRTGKCW